MNLIRRRNDTKTQLRIINSKLSEVFIVHYARGLSLIGENNWSPRIVCIAVRNLDNSINKCFAIHLEAEKQGIDRISIEDWYDDLELAVIDEFIAFIKKNVTHIWLHWEMNNVRFGFEAIKHRYSVLSSKNDSFPVIPANNIFDINNILESLYGDNFVAEPKLRNLIKINNKNKIPVDYNNDQEEGDCFLQKNFDQIQRSVLCKVDYLSKIIQGLYSRNIIVESKNTWGFLADFLTHPVVSFIGLISAFLGIIGAIYQLYLWI